MKNFLYCIFFLFSMLPFSLFANESSEQIISVDEACLYSEGVHLPRIEGILEQPSFTYYVNSEYGMEGFYKFRESVYFVVFDSELPQNFATLIKYNCTTNQPDFSHKVHGYEQNIQYSPSVSKVTNNYILLNDYQRINNASLHVSVIYDRSAMVAYHIRDEFLRKVPKVSNFVKDKQFYWDVISYSKRTAIIEVRISSTKKMTFAIRLPI